jgi:nucleoside-diphosphate-sugar epimerase
VPPGGCPQPGATIRSDRLVIGCGYLGLRVAAGWLARGDRVLATTRRPGRAAELARLGLEPVLCGAEAVRAAAERGTPGAIYNVADDRPVRRRDFSASLAGLLGAPPPRSAPGPAGESANRRVVNRLLREALGVRLRYPSYEEGLPASLGGGPPALESPPPPSIMNGVGSIQSRGPRPCCHGSTSSRTSSR